ncbi:MAG: PilZ domain-containing protein [bacterium]
MSEDQASERRTSRRVPYRARVKAVGALAGEGRTTNLSAGGVYLQRLSGRRLRQGDVVDLVLDLPGGAVRARGQVVKAVDEVFYPGAAVAFTTMSAADRALLEGFVAGRRGAPPRGAILGRIPVKRQVA